MEKSCKLCPHLFWVLSIPVFIIIYLITALTVAILLPFAYFGSERVVKSIIVGWSRLIFMAMGKRLRVQGKANILKDQRYILLANHSSLFDILAIMVFSPDVSWFGKEYLVKIPVFGRLLKMINFVPMRAADLGNTRNMIAQLAEKTNGHTVAIFPEGTRTVDGSINKFRKGFLHVLRASELSILPVTLNGFYRFKPKNRFYINFGVKLRVIIHQPINAFDLIHKPDSEIIDHIKGIIESAYENRLHK